MDDSWMMSPESSELITIGAARVSTDKQGYAQALARMVRDLQAVGCDRVYPMVASRTDEERPDIEKIIEAIQAKEVCRLVVPAVDRLTADFKLFDRLCKVALAENVEILSLREGLIDLSSPAGIFKSELSLLLARHEVNTTRARIKASKASYRKKGRVLSSPPFGYAVEDGKYKLNRTPFLCLLKDRREYTVADIAADTIAMFDKIEFVTPTLCEFNKKFGIQKIQKAPTQRIASVIEAGEEFKLRPIRPYGGRLGWCARGFQQWLINPVLAGHTPYSISRLRQPDDPSKAPYRVRKPKSEWEIQWNSHSDERLLNDAEQQSLERKLEMASRLKGWGARAKASRRGVYPLVGLIYCSRCGGRMRICASPKSRGDRDSYYQCANYSQAKTCTARATISEPDAIAAAIDAIVKQAESVATAVDLALDEEPQESEVLQGLRQQLEALERIPGKNPAIEAAKKQLRGQIEQEQAAITVQEEIDEGKESLFGGQFRDRSFWAEMSREDQKALFPDLIDRVVIGQRENPARYQSGGWEGYVESVELR